MRVKKRTIRFFIFILLLIMADCIGICAVKREAVIVSDPETPQFVETFRAMDCLEDYSPDTGKNIYIRQILSVGKDETLSERSFLKMERIHKDFFAKYEGYLEAVTEDLLYFPVPECENDPSYTVSFVNSWMNERTFGGRRGHEGCDIMADKNVRGIYPVVSITDGTVEKIGWLTRGGYRIGVRSEHGAYFYYAHLASYSRDFEPGDPVCAGELLGFMGDTGYSEVEGTTGMFDVHLHVGIYLNDENGEEFSVNPYYVLKYLEGSRLQAEYQQSSFP